MTATFDFDKYSRKNRFRVTIFGSSRIKKNDKTYKDVYDLAKMAGERGYDVITGGGPGIMEAANTGHREGNKSTKSQSVGLSIILPHEQKTNRGVQVEKKFDRFSKRLDKFMLLSNVVVVAPGGVGTLLELFYTWQLVQVRQMRNIPIILMGQMWAGLLDWLKLQPLKRNFFDSDEFWQLTYAHNSKETIKLIDEAFKKYNEN